MVTDQAILSQAAATLQADLASGTAPSAAVQALRSAAASLSSASRAAGQDLIPDCVPGAHQAEVTGLTELDRAAAGFHHAADETGGGDYGTVRRALREAVTAARSGSAKMASAITSLNRYDNR